MIYLELFLSFLQVGLFSIGGGYAAIPLIQAQVVTNHQWITMSEFSNLVTIAEMTPGPIAINAATFVGTEVAGFTGAIIATLGCITPSLIIVSILAKIYYKYKNITTLQEVLSSLRPAVVALIFSAGLTILLDVLANGGALAFDSINWFGGILFLISVIILQKFKPSPILIICICGIIGVVYGCIIA